MAIKPNKKGVVSGTESNDKITWSNSKDWKKALTVNAGLGNDNINFKKSTYKNKINGEDGNDTIYGGTNADTITGGTGNDKIWGGNGNDNIDGGADNDNLYGEAGNDTIKAGAGNDTINGGKGNDTIYLSAGNNTVKFATGDGTDTINKGTGNDTLEVTSKVNTNNIKVAKSGNDLKINYTTNDAAVLKNFFTSGTSVTKLKAGGKTNTLEGFLNDSTFTLNGKNVSGTEYKDKITGTSAADTLKGNGGNDKLYGNSGNDNIRGGNGNDSLEGGDGNDKLYGDTGNDTIRGGNGNDSIEGGEGKDSLFGDAGNDTIKAGAGNDIITGGKGNDTIYLSAGNNTVKFATGDGTDTINKGTGNDTLEVTSKININNIKAAKSGNDLKINYTSSDAAVLKNFFTSGTSVTTLKASGKTTTLENFLNSSTFTLSGKSVSGTDYKDKITGTSAADTLKGNAGNDTINGGDGNDNIDGGTGNDSLYGEAGNDTIRGSAGNDTINGGKGNDTIYTGTGSNTVIINKGDGNDTIYAEDSTKTTVKINSANAKDTTAYVKSGNDLKLTYTHTKASGEKTNTKEVITFKNYFNADGTVKNDEIYLNTTSNKKVSELLNSKGVTISGNGTLTGTQFKDTITGGDGNDVIHTNGGRDTVTAGKGDDTIYIDGNNAGTRINYNYAIKNTLQNNGHDVIYGSSSKDTIYIEAGNAAGRSEMVFVRDNNDLKMLSFDGRHESLEGLTPAGSITIKGYYSQAEDDRIDNIIVHTDVVATTPDGNELVVGDNAFSLKSLLEQMNNNEEDNPVEEDIDDDNTQYTVINGADNPDDDYADVINGTNADEKITGGLGNDTITAGGGKNQICYHLYDNIEGDCGTDTILNGSGTDTLVFDKGTRVEAYFGEENDENNLHISYWGEYQYEDAGEEYYGDGYGDVIVENFKSGSSVKYIKIGNKKPVEIEEYVPAEYTGTDNDDTYVSRMSNESFNLKKGNDTITFNKKFGHDEIISESEFVDGVAVNTDTLEFTKYSLADGHISFSYWENYETQQGDLSIFATAPFEGEEEEHAHNGGQVVYRGFFSDETPNLLIKDAKDTYYVDRYTQPVNLDWTVSDSANSNHVTFINGNSGIATVNSNTKINMIELLNGIGINYTYNGGQDIVNNQYNADDEYTVKSFTKNTSLRINDSEGTDTLKINANAEDMRLVFDVNVYNGQTYTYEPTIVHSDALTAQALVNRFTSGYEGMATITGIDVSTVYDYDQNKQVLSIENVYTNDYENGINVSYWQEIIGNRVGEWLTRYNYQSIWMATEAGLTATQIDELYDCYNVAYTATVVPEYQPINATSTSADEIWNFGIGNNQVTFSSAMGNDNIISEPAEYNPDNTDTLVFTDLSFENGTLGVELANGNVIFGEKDNYYGNSVSYSGLITNNTHNDLQIIDSDQEVYNVFSSNEYIYYNIDGYDDNHIVISTANSGTMENVIISGTGNNIILTSGDVGTEYTYNGGKDSIYTTSQNSDDTYTVNSFDANTRLSIKDNGGTDVLVFNSSSEDARILFSGNEEDNSLFIVHSSKFSAEHLDELKAFLNNNEMTGGVVAVNAKTEQQGFGIELVKTTDHTEGLNTELWYNTIRGNIVQWMQNHPAYQGDPAAVMENGSNQDILSFLNCYNVSYDQVIQQQQV